MSPALFQWVLVAGTMALALWVGIRFPALAPQTLRGVVVRVSLAVAALAATAPAVGAARTGTDRLAALVLVALPSGVIVALAATWLLLWVARTTRT